MPDIFISYAHVNNKPKAPSPMGWVTQFINLLKNDLGQQMGRDEDASFWMDFELKGNDEITPTILKALHESAAIVIFLSNAYLASPWCRKELAEFLTRPNLDRSKIFTIELDPLVIPETLLDLKRYRFWQRNNEGKVRRLADPMPDASEKTYYEKIVDLGVDLASTLKAHHLTEQQNRAAIVPPPRSNGPIVFLARVPEQLEKERDQILRHLDQLGVECLPRHAYPMNPERAYEALQRDLQSAQMFIQILDDDIFDGDPLYQCMRAEEHQLPMMQWYPSQVVLNAINDPEHLKLLEGNQVRTGCLVEFMEAVRCHLFETPKPAPAAPEDLLVFVDAGHSDRQLAQEIAASLEQRDVGYLMMDVTDDVSPSEFREELETNLLGCDAILMLYHQGPCKQVKERLMQCRRIQAKRDEPFKLVSLCIKQGSESGPPPPKINLPGMQRINADEACVDDCVGEFLSAVQP